MADFDQIKDQVLTTVKNIRVPETLLKCTLLLVVFQVLRFFLGRQILGSIFMLVFLGFWGYVFYDSYSFNVLKKRLPTTGAVVITGVSSGLGKDMAYYLAARGFDVYGTVRKEADKTAFEQQAKELKVKGECKALLCDVQKEDQIRKLRDSLEAEGKPIIGLINNAGISNHRCLETASHQHIQSLIQTNVIGVIAVTMELLPLIRKGVKTTGRRGRVAIVSSLSGVAHTPMNVMYCSSKAANDAMINCLSAELRGLGIDCATIRPGFTKSDIFGKAVHTIEDIFKKKDEQDTDERVKERREVYESMAEKDIIFYTAGHKTAVPAERISELAFHFMCAQYPLMAYHTLGDSNRVALCSMPNYVKSVIYRLMVLKEL
eukprot:Clim_evm63s201 gene=Clim_evmTU63s201